MRGFLCMTWASLAVISFVLKEWVAMFICIVQIFVTITTVK